jgi:hypothetical protein
MKTTYMDGFWQFLLFFPLTSGDRKPLKSLSFKNNNFSFHILAMYHQFLKKAGKDTHMAIRILEELWGGGGGGREGGGALNGQFR